MSWITSSTNSFKCPDDFKTFLSNQGIDDVDCLLDMDDNDELKDIKIPEDRAVFKSLLRRLVKFEQEKKKTSSSSSSSAACNNNNNDDEKYCYLEEIQDICEDTKAILKKNRFTLDIMLDEDTTRQDFLDIGIVLGDVKKILKWIQKKKESPEVSAPTTEENNNLLLNKNDAQQTQHLDPHQSMKKQDNDNNNHNDIANEEKSPFKSNASAAAAASTTENENENESSSSLVNVALKDTTVSGSLFAGNFNRCTIDASQVHNTYNVTNTIHETISEWLQEQNYLKEGTRQALADIGIKEKNQFFQLFHRSLDEYKFPIDVKEQLEECTRRYWSDIAHSKQNVESRNSALRGGFKARFEIEDKVGGRAVSMEKSFTRLRIRNDVNRKSPSSSTFSSSSAAAASSSPSSPASPTYNDDINEGKIVDGEELHDIATSASSTIVLNSLGGGAGKTWLAQMLSVQQRSPNAHLIFISLRDLKASDRTIESVSDLLDFAVGDYLTKEQRKEIVLGEYPIVWICDGFDEVQWCESQSNMGRFLHNFVDPTQRSKNVKNSDEFKNFVRPCDFIIVTSREERTANKNVNLDVGRVDHYVIERWSDSEVKEYCNKWFSLMRENKNFDVEKASIDVVNALRADSLQGFSGLPLFVNMICELRLDSSGTFGSLSPSSIFANIIELFWERSRKKIRDCLAAKIDDYKLSSANLTEELFIEVMQQAAQAGFNQFVSEKIEDFTAITFDLKTFKFHRNKPLPPLWVVLLEQAGLVQFVSGQRTKARFPHRSYIEFLCAKHASENAATSLSQQENARTILWTQKFATVWILLADLVRISSSSPANSNINKNSMKLNQFIAHAACCFYLTYNRLTGEQSNDPIYVADICNLMTLLRLTMILSSSCDQLLESIKKKHGFFVFKTPRYFLLLAELSGKIGSIQALEWIEKTYKNDVTLDLLKLALGHALDRQELPAVANFVGALTKPPRNIPVSLEHAVKTGSVVGTTIAASKKENSFDAEEWCRYLKLAFSRQQYEIAAVLLMYGDWKFDKNKKLSQFLPFSLPKSVSIKIISSESLQNVSIQNVSPGILFTLVVSRLPSSLRLWNSEKQVLDQQRRSSVAGKCGVKHLESEADQLLFFFVSVASMLNVSVIAEMIFNVKKVAVEMKLQNTSSLLEDPLLAALTIASLKKETRKFNAESWTRYLKLAFERQQYDVAAVLLMNGDWFHNKENSRRQILPLVLEPEKFPLPTNFTCDLQGLKSALVLKIPSSIRMWITSTNSFEQKSRDIVVASSLGLNDVESCRVSCAKFLEEAAIAIFTQNFDRWNLAAPFAVVVRTKVVFGTKEFDEYLTPYVKTIPSKVVVDFCQYLEDFAKYRHSKSQFHATLVRDALLWISKYIISAESVRKWCYCVCYAISDNEEANREIFGTEQVRDAFVMIAEFATYDEVCLFSAISQLTEGGNEFNQKLFGTAEILKIFVSLSKTMSSKVISSHSIFLCNWLNALLNIITGVKENQQVFGTAELRDSMILVANFVDNYSRDQWLQLLAVLTDNNETVKKIFLVDALKDEKARIEKIQ